MNTALESALVRPPDVVTLAIPVFVLLVFAEMLYVRFTRRGSYEVWDSGASLMMGLGNSVIAGLLAGFILRAHYLVYSYRLLTLRWTWWTALLCFFAEDLTYYCFHRVSHERRWFWASHVIHHSSQHYNLSTALRQTWTGGFGLAWMFWLPLSFLGFPPAMVLMFSGASIVYQFWIHTEVIERLGPLEWVMNTPSHHRVHHATNPSYLDANYAGVLIIWDRLLGSFVRERDDEKPRYGIVSNLGCFNPLRIAFHEWISIWHDLRQSRSLSDVFRFVLGPPGWSPDGSRKTTASIKKTAELMPRVS